MIYFSGIGRLDQDQFPTQPDLKFRAFNRVSGSLLCIYYFNIWSILFLNVTYVSRELKDQSIWDSSTILIAWHVEEKYGKRITYSLLG